MTMWREGLWYGELQELWHGSTIVVFESGPENDPGDKIVRLFDLSSKTFRSFDKRSVRARLRSVPAPGNTSTLDVRAAMASAREHDKRIAALLANEGDRGARQPHSPPMHYEESDEYRADLDDPMREIREEISEYWSNMARSEADGWFYADE